MFTENVFSKYKRKYLIEAIIKSIICGISAGLLAVGVVLLSLKLSAVTINVGFYVLIGLGVALACGAAVFLMLRPTDKRTAKRLDEEHKLDERAQTALAYKEQSGYIIELQRKDAGEKVRNLPHVKYSFAKVWQYCVIVFVALAISFTSFFIPARQIASGSIEDPGPGFTDEDDTPYELTPFQEARVRELIDNVNDSNFTVELKADVVGELEDLIENLREAETVGEMRTCVKQTVYNVNQTVGATLHYLQFISDSENIFPEIATAVKDGIATYNSYTLTDYNNVKFYDTQKLTIITGKVTPNTIKLNEKTSISKADGLAAKIAEVLGTAQNLLTAVGGKNANVYAGVISDFISDMESVQKLIASSSNTVLQGKLLTVYSNLANNLTDAIGDEAYTYAMGTFVGYRLFLIFGMDALIPGSGIGPGSGTKPDDNPEDRDPSIGGGGWGGGDIVYGGDDEIFNPLTGDYEKFDTLLKQYLEILDEYVQKGYLTPEQEHAARVYLQLLGYGFDD
ncbi:MAG: hypothetical protein J1G05_03120 [Clostridiales bacterium]|nr:hypothetical protein [Clostridiales bacterium]